MKALRFALLLFVAGTGAPATAQDGGLANVKEQELEEVRRRISELKETIEERSAARDRLTAELQAAEEVIAGKRMRLKEIEREREVSTRRRAELDARLTSRRAELEREAGQLAEQVRAAYMSGGQERLRLLLNQHDPATLGRLLAYYGYLNDYRAGNMASITAGIREIATLRGEVAAEEAQLVALADERYAELTRLNAAQEERRSLLETLRARLADEGREVERLAAEERELSRLIAELTSILADYPINSEDPFAAHKGRLTWPVAGSLVRDFGQPRGSSDLKWNGVVLSAPRGREVRSVYHGRVVFADWLAGLGLLVVIDHGDGYLSLYGYNETLLKDSGDWVAPGDVIATVGDSGGQASFGLYFELRQGSRPLDPHQWVTRQPRG